MNLETHLAALIGDLLAGSDNLGGQNLARRVLESALDSRLLLGGALVDVDLDNELGIDLLGGRGRNNRCHGEFKRRERKE
jgi:hypothetical protein